MLKILPHTTGDNEQLFFDMHNYNPYAKKIRQSFINSCEFLDERIDENDLESKKNKLDFYRKFLDKYDGEIFHDQYRLYDELNDDIPLLDQILQFWQFDNIDWDNIRPEMYWSDDEQKLGDKIINNHCGNQKFGTFLISDRFGTRYGKFDQACFDNEHKLLTEKIGDYKLPYFYWSSKPIGDIPFELPNAVLDMKHMDLRIQLYIRSKGEVCIGNQSGVLQTISRYTELYMPQRQWPLGGNFVSGEHYMNIFDKNEILKNIPDKTESKTTTSLKFKSDLIDYFSNDKYRDYTVLEIGSSLGHSTHVLSFLFKTVTAVDNLPERHQISKKLNANRNNIDYVITDVYNRPWEFEPADVVFIDCVHDYIHVKKDIDNTLQSFEKPLIIFDDYGLFPELKLAIDEYVERGILKIETYLGAPIGTYYPKTQNKILKDWEGLVCRVV